MSDVQQRRMIPARHERWPVWELSVDGDVIGWVYEIRIRGTPNPFYRAVGIHRASGRRIELERSTDRAERIHTIFLFWHDPMTAAQHLPQDLHPADHTLRPHHDAGDGPTMSRSEELETD